LSYIGILKFESAFNHFIFNRKIVNNLPWTRHARCRTDASDGGVGRSS